MRCNSALLTGLRPEPYSPPCHPTSCPSQEAPPPPPPPGATQPKRRRECRLRAGRGGADELRGLAQGPPLGLHQQGQSHWLLHCSGQRQTPWLSPRVRGESVLRGLRSCPSPAWCSGPPALLPRKMPAGGAPHCPRHPQSASRHGLRASAVRASRRHVCTAPRCRPGPLDERQSSFQTGACMKSSVCPPHAQPCPAREGCSHINEQQTEASPHAQPRPRGPSNSI